MFTRHRLNPTTKTRLSTCHGEVARFHHSGHGHFVTFCCYHHRRLFIADASRQIFRSAPDHKSRQGSTTEHLKTQSGRELSVSLKGEGTCRTRSPWLFVF